MKRFPRLPFVVLALVAAWGLKAWYSRAGADELGWLLAPTCRLAAALSGARFDHEAGAGWVDHADRLIVGAGCSGMNFLIISFLTIACAAIHRAGSAGTRLLCVPLSLAAAWSLTIATNAARIVVALRLLSYDLEVGLLTAPRLHRAAGALVYCLSLVLAHLGVERFFDRRGAPAPPRTAWQALAPLGWYVAVALGLPVLDQAWRRDPELFREHAALVLAVVLVAGAAITAVRKAWPAPPRGKTPPSMLESARGRVPAEEP